MTFILAVFAIMAGKDVVQALYTRNITGGHPWLAGNFDGVGDVGAVFTTGMVGGDAVVHGVTFQLALTLLALHCGSVIGTVLGDRTENWLKARRKTRD